MLEKSQTWVQRLAAWDEQKCVHTQYNGISSFPIDNHDVKQKLHI